MIKSKLYVYCTYFPKGDKIYKNPSSAEEQNRFCLHIKNQLKVYPQDYYGRTDSMNYVVDPHYSE